MKGARFDALVFGQVAASVLENEQGALLRAVVVRSSDCHTSRSLGSLSNASRHVWRLPGRFIRDNC